MKTCLYGLFVLSVFLSSSGKVSGLGSVVSRSYRHIQSHYTWAEAQSFCRRYYHDLATIYKSSDKDLIYTSTYYTWIGLYRTPASTWAWSNGDFHFFDGWAKHEPHDSEACAFVLYSAKRFYGSSCEGRYFFFCHDEKQNHYEYTFIPLTKSWSEAREYCRSNYDDLATFPLNSSLQSIGGKRFPVWIGLHKEDETWRWSKSYSDYTNWGNGEPNNDGNCVSISSTEKDMYAQDCALRFPFVCMVDNVVVVKENKTWEEALDHCRNLTSPDNSNNRYELLSVQPGDDQEYVMIRVSEAETEEVWVSLRFLAGRWLWINEADLRYDGLPECPVDLERCGVLSKANTTGVEIRDCAERRNFLCYRK